jgi:DNA repair protein SbcD/Mre11
MHKSLRFLHTADLHLDSPFKGMSNVPDRIFRQIKESTFHAFDKVIECAIKEKVDFVLIVGDLFDDSSRSLKAQLKLVKSLEKLNQHNIQAFICFGNHDYLGGDFFNLDFPDNVHVFMEEGVTHFPFYKEGEHVANIYGFSYEERAVTKPKVKEYELTSDPVYHIGMLHGSLATNIDHDVYAPFRLSDFDRSRMDYWALGHIHKRESLLTSPPVIYPGNIQGRHIKETGDKGVYIITLESNGCEFSFKPTHHIRFEQVEIDARECQQLDELEQLITIKKNEIREQYGQSIIRLHVDVEEAKLESITHDMMVELMDIVNEREEEEKRWVWIEEVKLNKRSSWNIDELKKGKHFTGELLRVIEATNNPSIYVKDITDHRDIRKFLDPFTQEEMEEIVKNAQQILMEELMRR